MSYSEPLINQPRVLFLSIGVGVVICMLYIIIQSFSKILGQSKPVIYFADITFCVLFTLVSFFFMVLYNNGRVRLHLIMGEVAGFFLFYFSVGKYIYALLVRTAEFIRKAGSLFLKPYVIIGRSFASGVRDMGYDVNRKIRALKKDKADNGNSAEKNKKKFKFIGKIHLKNPDKSV